MIVPHAIDAERAVIGAMLIKGQAVADAAAMLHPEDFGQPILGAMFAACVDLWKVGQQPDPTLVAERLRAGGVVFENPDLISLQAGAPSLNPVPHARLVAEYAARRRGIALADEMRERFANPGVDVADTIDRTKAELDVAQLPMATSVNDVVSVQTFTETADDPLSWVLPGLLDEQDRMIVVAVARCRECGGEYVVSVHLRPLRGARAERDRLRQRAYRGRVMVGISQMWTGRNAPMAPERVTPLKYNGPRQGDAPASVNSRGVATTPQEQE